MTIQIKTRSITPPTLTTSSKKETKWAVWRSRRRFCVITTCGEAEKWPPHHNYYKRPNNSRIYRPIAFQLTIWALVRHFLLGKVVMHRHKSKIDLLLECQGIWEHQIMGEAVQGQTAVEAQDPESSLTDLWESPKETMRAILAVAYSSQTILILLTCLKNILWINVKMMTKDSQQSQMMNAPNTLKVWKSLTP